MCDDKFFPQKGEILTNLGLFLAFKAVNILLGGICMPNLKIYTERQLVKVKKLQKWLLNQAPVVFPSSCKILKTGKYIDSFETAEQSLF